MAKEKNIDPTETLQAPSTPFTPDQMEYVLQMINNNRPSAESSRSSAVSLFKDVRNPKEIMSCPVYRFDGKFVIGFKDLNKDPYRKAPKYSENKLDINRKLSDQPFVTLLLSLDGVDVEEKEVPLIDYMNNRMKVEIPKSDFTIEQRDVITDYGILGRGASNQFAQDFDASGRPAMLQNIKAETKTTERTFIVKLPGFEKPVTYIEAFLA